LKQGSGHKRNKNRKEKITAKKGGGQLGGGGRKGTGASTTP